MRNIRLREKNLVVRPSDGLFDVAEARAFLERRPDVVPSPVGAHKYLLVEDPETADLTFERWFADPNRTPYVAVVRLTTDYVTVSQEYQSHHERAALALLRWLIERHDVRIVHDGYADYTDQIREHGIEAFYDPEDARDDAPWRHHLIGVGFYVELPGERGVDPHRHLAHAIADTPQESEAELAAYLRAGVRFRDFLPDTWDPDYDPAEPMLDALDTRGPRVDAPRALLTDGVYVWGADLAHYVERYHARLPRAFWHHAHDRGWRIPTDLDVSRLSLATDGLL